MAIRSNNSSAAIAMVSFPKPNQMMTAAAFANIESIIATCADFSSMEV
jgi:hypothetical protein